MPGSYAECNELAKRFGRAFAGLHVSFDVAEAEVGFIVWVISQEKGDDFGPKQLGPYLPSREWKIIEQSSECRATTFLRQPERNKSANLLAADKHCFVMLAKRILFDTSRSHASPCLSGAAHLCRFSSFGLPYL